MKHPINTIASALLLFGTFLCFLLLRFLACVDFLVLNDALTGISSGLLGIALAVFGIYFAMPIRAELLDALKSQGHYSAIARDIIISVVQLVVGLALSIAAYLLSPRIANIIIVISLSINLAAVLLLVLSMYSIYLICFREKRTK